jgi:glutamine synthetase
MSAAVANTVINAIMADSLNRIAEELEGIKYLQDVRAKALDICRDIIDKHKRVLFSGDGYSEAWVKEAARRGLPNVKSFIESIEVLDDEKTIAMLTGLGIYTEKELAARKAIYAEQYVSVMGIEVKTMLSMVRKSVLPAMSAELKFYGDAMQAAVKPPKFIKDRVNELEKLIDRVYTGVRKLEQEYDEVRTIASPEKAGMRIYSETAVLMQNLRADIDRYEVIASPEFYKVPSYEEMLFSL